MAVSTEGVRGRYLDVRVRKIKDGAQRGKAQRTGDTGWTEDAGRSLGSYEIQVSCKGLENQPKTLDPAGSNDEAVMVRGELTAKGIWAHLRKSSESYCPSSSPASSTSHQTSAHPRTETFLDLCTASSHLTSRLFAQILFAAQLQS